MLSIAGLCKTFSSLGRPPVHALRGVDLSVGAGSVVGLVGESGSGKSTLLRSLMRLERPDAGSIDFEGRDVLALRGSSLKEYRRQVQMVFQDPMASLNPRMTVAQLVEEGMRVHHPGMPSSARAQKAAELLELVGLNPDFRRRHPSSFSGGQRQRIAIARALAVQPRLLVCDEPVSALDVSVQAQVLNLLLDMQRELGLSLLFVAHDLAVVRYLCPEIYVLRSGEMVEHASRDELFERPRHEYTRQLIAAAPSAALLKPSHDYLLPPTVELEI